MLQIFSGVFWHYARIESVFWLSGLSKGSYAKDALYAYVSFFLKSQTVMRW